MQQNQLQILAGVTSIFFKEKIISSYKLCIKKLFLITNRIFVNFQLSNFKKKLFLKIISH